VYLFGAVHPWTGDPSALGASWANTEYRNHHLRLLREQAGPDVQVILGLDRAGWHLSRALQVPESITRLPLPPYSPELNPVERLWAYLRSHYLSNRAYRDYDDLLQACGKAWNQRTSEQRCSICRIEWIPRTN
jgi:transposase